MSINIYNICKWYGGSRWGGGGGIVQASNKNRPLCKMVIFIVHQLYKYYIFYRDRTLVYLSLTVYFPYMLLK